MAIDFKNINLEVIDINTNASPDIFINLKGITFSKRVLDDLNYPQNVQYCIDAGNKIKSVPREGLCHDCGALYNVMRFEGQCPKCGSRDKKIISGRDFMIRNIMVETETA